jgi:hypothetical protein
VLFQTSQVRARVCTGYDKEPKRVACCLVAAGIIRFSIALLPQFTENRFVRRQLPA